MTLNPNVPYHGLTYKVIGAAMKVHSALRHGLREEVYQNALELQLAELGIQFSREYRTDVYYEGQPVGLYFLDFWVEEALVVELKAFPHFMTRQEVAQCLRYMQVTNSPVGLLLNFGRQRLEYQRVLPPTTWQPYNSANDLWLHTEGYQ